MSEMKVFDVGPEVFCLHVREFVPREEGWKHYRSFQVNRDIANGRCEFEMREGCRYEVRKPGGEHDLIWEGDA